MKKFDAWKLARCLQTSRRLFDITQCTFCIFEFVRIVYFVSGYRSLTIKKNQLQKFPERKTNEFYIMGESYAGVYIPMLGVRLLNASIANFKVSSSL